MIGDNTEPWVEAAFSFGRDADLTLHQIGTIIKPLFDAGQDAAKNGGWDRIENSYEGVKPENLCIDAIVALCRTVVWAKDVLPYHYRTFVIACREEVTKRYDDPRLMQGLDFGYD